MGKTEDWKNEVVIGQIYRYLGQNLLEKNVGMVLLYKDGVVLEDLFYLYSFCCFQFLNCKPLQALHEVSMKFQGHGNSTPICHGTCPSLKIFRTIFWREIIKPQKNLLLNLLFVDLQQQVTDYNCMTKKKRSETDGLKEDALKFPWDVILPVEERTAESCLSRELKFPAAPAS